MAENPIENPNSETYQSQAKSRLESLRRILSATIRNMPRNEVIEILKQKKIIKYEYSKDTDDLVLSERKGSEAINKALLEAGE